MNTSSLMTPAFPSGRQISMPVATVQERSRHISSLLDQIRDDGPALSKVEPRKRKPVASALLESAKVIDHPGREKLIRNRLPPPVA